MSTLSPDLPLTRSIVVVDAEGSTRRTNPAKAVLRDVLYEVLETALLASGIADEHRDPLVDRGDGALLLIYPVDAVPKTVLLTTFIPALRDLLDEHVARRPDHRIRLRTALHAGEVHYDRRGPFGEAIDITCKLLDAWELKIKLAQTEAPLVLVVSDDIYRSVIRHGYDGIDDWVFEPLVYLDVGGQTELGWVHVPDAGCGNGGRIEI